MSDICHVLKRYTNARTRESGDEYADSGRVKWMVDESKFSIRAEVAGSQDYTVRLRIVEYRRTYALESSCTCPFFAEHPCCKHIWAVGRRLDANGAFSEMLITEYLPNRNTIVKNVTVPARPKAKTQAAQSKASTPPAPRATEVAAWQKALRRVDEHSRLVPNRTADAQPRRAEDGQDLRFEIRPHAYGSLRNPVLAVATRFRLKNGEWGQWKRWDGTKVSGLPDEEYLLATVTAGLEKDNYSYESLSVEQGSRLLPRLCATGKLYCLLGGKEYGPVRWDAGPAWEVAVEIRQDDTRGGALRVRTALHRAEESIGSGSVLAIMGSWAFWQDALHALSQTKAGLSWLAAMGAQAEFEVRPHEAPRFVAELLSREAVPRLHLPEHFALLQQAGPPQPMLGLLKPTLENRAGLPARVTFQYGDVVVPARPWKPAFTASNGEHTILRDAPAEAAAMERLMALGARSPSVFERSDCHVTFPAGRLAELVSALLAEHWTVTAEEKLYRPAGAMSVAIRSGIDWFDLEAHCDFGGGLTVDMPTLLQAVRKKQTWVELGDGTYGMLPEAWLKKWGSLLPMGQIDGAAVRFTRAQTGLLDAWLADQPDAQFDEAFATAREELRSFTRIGPAKAPAGFVGTLRPYQEEGLGWLLFLQRFRLGGCLADDMGLGKTVQVLALLESRRAQRRKEKLPPSLVVAPRSLIFNWQREAAQFAPKLRLVDYTGGGRELEAGWETKTDVVLTTYGTLRQDIGLLMDIEFDYAILDESQAIKNAVAQTAKASRLLKARHRLAMSGTPMENHLGELWSLMDFLNPGLLGGSGKFAAHWSKDPEEDQRKALGRALRPFLLRRTKAQVAPDLPERQEDTLYCEMAEEQRKQYEEVRDFYRKSLLGGAEKDGDGQNKIQVLEALLRLRQAACHTGLLDSRRRRQACAKFEALLPRLEALAEEGHKALVFSQFTELLGILREELDRRKMTYEYLDGQTRDRQACVDRFQNQPDVRLFLISLKAGGLGLNLTAAEYVFLLDPWWNPAVEAQAIDRAHRIGQANKVMAYRLIAAGTVEEKVLTLQQKKKQLADAILREDNAVLRDLTRADLELLLS